MVGLMGDVVEQGVFRGQAPADDTLEHGRDRARPDLLLGDPDSQRKAEPPVKLEVAAVRSLCCDLEPPVFLVAEDALETRGGESAGQAPHVGAAHQKIDVREHPLPGIVVKIDQVGAALQKKERYTLLDEVPPHDAEFGKRLKIVQRGLPMGPRQCTGPPRRQEVPPALRLPATVQVAAALVPLQAGVGQVRGRILSRDVQAKKRRDRLVQIRGGRAEPCGHAG